MKKLFLAMLALAGISVTASAQTAPAQKTVSPVVAKHAVKPATAAKQAPGTAMISNTKGVKVKPVAAAKPVATNGPVKKDGRPDMRYKTNKITAAKATTHFKKNGTPDKRFKENKS